MKKRNLFAEITEGFDALTDERAGKQTLRTHEVEIHPAPDVTAANLPQDKVGQRVQVRVRIGERKAIVIPRRYISTRFGVDYVRLVAADGTVSEAPVQTAEGPTADTAEILSGVRAGDVLTPAAVAR